MYEKILIPFKEKPSLYAKSTAPMWDDEHISKGMLSAHLNPNIESASRQFDFIEQSVQWINRLTNSNKCKKLLDLGCGPGIYTELFHRIGFEVIGIDFSKRSIDYAKENARKNHLSVKYLYKNYLEIEYENEFDVVTLIYCDFGVLSPYDRNLLLNKIYRALKKGGILVFDVFSEIELTNFKEGNAVKYCKEGFWRPIPHIVIQNNYIYPETNNYLEQYIVITEEECQCYNNWNKVFNTKSLEKEMSEANFANIKLYDNVCGKELSDKSNTICIVAKK